MIWVLVVSVVILAVVMTANRSVLMSVLYGVKGVTGGLVDMVSLLEESSPSFDDVRKQTTRRIANFGRIAFPGYERFEAWTQCPSCDRIAVHAMRPPKPAPIRGPLRVIEHDDGSRSEIRTFNGMTTTGPDESVYDTIRICDCGQEWGQR